MKRFAFKETREDVRRIELPVIFTCLDNVRQERIGRKRNH